MKSLNAVVFAALCTAVSGMAQAATSPVTDITDLANAPHAAASLTLASTPAGDDGVADNLLSYGPLSLISTPQDLAYVGHLTLVDTSVSPASAQQLAALLVAGLTLVAYRARNQPLPKRLLG